MSNPLPKSQIWLFNISKMNVSLADLGFTIKANSHLNLLSGRFPHLTEEMINKSIESGSIFKKKSKLRVSRVEPEFPKPLPIPVTKTPRQSKSRSALTFEEVSFPELELQEPIDDE